MSAIPPAPKPPKAACLAFGPYQPADLQHQLLEAARKLRHRPSIPLAPPPPAPATLTKFQLAPTLPYSLKDQLYVGIRRLEQPRKRPIPSPPPAPQAAIISSLWNVRWRPLKEELPGVCEDILTRTKRKTAIPKMVREDAVRAAEDMRKALSEKNPPLAPAAPAPVLVAGAMKRPVFLGEVTRAAEEMSKAHYPPLAPAAPAPDLITKDATLSKPLKQKILPAAIKTQQNVEPAPAVVPTAPPPPAPMRIRESQFVMPSTLRDSLLASVERRKARQKERPPLPPRPAVTLAAMAIMQETTVRQEPPSTSTLESITSPATVSTTGMPTATSTVTTLPAVTVTTPVTEAGSLPSAATVASTTPAIAVSEAVPRTTMSSRCMEDCEEGGYMGEVAPITPGEKEIKLEGLSRKQKKMKKETATHSPSTPTENLAVPTTTNRGRRGSIGMKIKGAVKEVAGALTRNQAKKQEGKLLMQGIEPATSTPTADTSRV